LKTRGIASGWDEIGNIVLRKLPRRGIAALLNIVNAILQLRHFPADWKRADVILFPKPQKDLLFPQNYGPISLLSSLEKVAEVIILRRLKEQEENLHVILD